MKNRFCVLHKVIIICSVLLLFSCSESDNDTSSRFKITITLNEVNPTDDFVSVTVVGNNQSGNVTLPLWRLNGSDQTNSLTVSLDKNDFSGNTKTYVIESIRPIQIFSAGFQIINYGDPLTGTLKIENNGTIMVNETINLVGDNTDFTENYSVNN